MRGFLFTSLLLLIAVSSNAQLTGDGWDETNLYARTKQVNQFFRRFNGEEDVKGNRYYQGDVQFRSEGLRKKYVSLLFDKRNKGLTRPLMENFVKRMLNRESPVFLDMHKTEWFAEVQARFLYRGLPKTLILFLELQDEEVGSNWVIRKVYFSPYHRVLSLDRKEKRFIHPMSHELDFMNLRKAFSNKDSLATLVHRAYEPDQLSLFLYDLKIGNLEFLTVNEVKFHFFPVDGWYFELSQLRKEGANTGWLISDLVEVQPQDKKALLSFIYHRRR